MKILVVDDEKVIVKGIRFNLEHEGYQVDGAYDGQSAVDMARGGAYDLIILDVMMPEIDGLEACMSIRKFSDVPIIMLTAKGEDTDKLMGFDCGADDYMTKPFNILELKARVRALLRRTTQSSAEDRKEEEITIDRLTLDRRQHVARCNGQMVELTAKEYDLLELFMQHPRRVYSREMLMDLIWGYAYQADFRTVDVHVRRLREKVEENPAKPVYILTKWGVGYYFKG